MERSSKEWKDVVRRCYSRERSGGGKHLRAATWRWSRTCVLVGRGGIGMTKFNLKTTVRNQFVEITHQIRDAIAASGVKSGLCVVYCPHTTAAITVNENADPDVVHDMLLYLNKTVPKDQSGFRHEEGNSDSHIKASLVGPSVTLLVDGGDIVLGRWQGVYFCEFDGPRTREVMVKVLGG
jgi:secondary thiamine-phosphate synthase enzyme